MKVFIDTCIPMYAAGGDHPFRKSCQEIIIAVASGDLNAYTNTEVLQEILYRFYRIQRKETGYQLFDYFARVMDGSILPVTAHDLMLARHLSFKYEESNLSPWDLIHLAVMLNNNIKQIITTDKSFQSVGEVTVIVP